jgi:hypothetical protein
VVLITFNVYGEVVALALGSFYMGFSVDEPLPERFSDIPGKVIGVQRIYIVGKVSFGPTQVTVNVREGDHYVILGIQPADLSLAELQAYRLRLQGAGTEIDRTFTSTVAQYVYITFNVDKNGAVTPIGTGVIAAGGAPIQTPGGGGIFGGDIGGAIAGMIGPLMEMMIPIMMLNMMINMMAGLVQSVTGMVRL